MSTKSQHKKIDSIFTLFTLVSMEDVFHIKYIIFMLSFHGNGRITKSAYPKNKKRTTLIFQMVLLQEKTCNNCLDATKLTHFYYATTIEGQKTLRTSSTIHNWHDHTLKTQRPTAHQTPDKTLPADPQDIHSDPQELPVNFNYFDVTVVTHTLKGKAPKLCDQA